METEHNKLVLNFSCSLERTRRVLPVPSLRAASPPPGPPAGRRCQGSESSEGKDKGKINKYTHRGYPLKWSSAHSAVVDPEEPKSFAACVRPRTRLVWEPRHPPLDRGCVRPWGREGAAARTGTEATAVSSSAVQQHPALDPRVSGPDPCGWPALPGSRDGEPWGPSTCATAQPCLGKPKRSRQARFREKPRETLTVAACGNGARSWGPAPCVTASGGVGKFATGTC